MRRPWLMCALAAAASLLAACGGQSSVAAGPAPVTTTGRSVTALAPTSSASASSAPTRTAVRPTPRFPATAAVTTATTSPRSHPTTRAPAPHATDAATASPSTAPCAGVAGSTTTIQEAAGYRFSPATVRIRRCDSVKAVYADTTGTPHTWQGKTWSSGNMTSTSNSAYSYQFTSTGTFNFVCAYHQQLGMVGSVTVG